MGVEPTLPQSQCGVLPLHYDLHGAGERNRTFTSFRTAAFETAAYAVSPRLLEASGGPGRNRTGYLVLAKHPLYQLSYKPTYVFMVGQTGVEPATSRSQAESATTALLPETKTKYHDYILYHYYM